MSIDDDVAHVIGLERSLLRPETRGSAEAVEALLDPEFREVGASGRRWSREEMVSALLADPGTVVIVDHDMRGTALADGLVLLEFVTDNAGRWARRTSLWRRGDGGWRILHHQGTLMAPPS